MPSDKQPFLFDVNTRLTEMKAIIPVWDYLSVQKSLSDTGERSALQQVGSRKYILVYHFDLMFCGGVSG
jgi:hypothetical protein